jgi:hypothetical protein
VTRQNMVPHPHPERPLAERFAAWAEENPEIIDLAAGVALQLRQRGFEHYSMDGIWHILRWEYGAKAPSETSGAQPDVPVMVDLNNDFTPGLARLLMARYPELDGFFRTRRSQMDAAAA